MHMHLRFFLHITHQCIFLLQKALAWHSGPTKGLSKPNTPHCTFILSLSSSHVVCYAYQPHRYSMLDKVSDATSCSHSVCAKLTAWISTHSYFRLAFTWKKRSKQSGNQGLKQTPKPSKTRRLTSTRTFSNFQRNTWNMQNVTKTCSKNKSMYYKKQTGHMKKKNTSLQKPKGKST